MSAFELPELYMPYPARLNPNVESARVHTKAWAREMGMLAGSGAERGEFGWDPKHFDAHEFALLCAYTHPDLPPSELDLMSDWYVWLFFFDDYFLEAFKRKDDVAGGKRFLARLWDYLPLELDAPLPAATNPVERGMAQLWIRSTPGTTRDWRRRYIAHTRDTLETVLWEHSNIRHARVANPLEYIAMRRMVGGCIWAACLLERANGLKLPDPLLASRPVRLLHDAFADSEHLHNDLMSYSREVGEESENANGVLVFERFMDLDPQSAANLSSDLLSARLHQFEHTVLVELPLYFEEYGVPAHERVDVLRYANGLMAWISGAYDWHFQSSRYDLERPYSPTGGTARPDYIGPLGVRSSTTRLLQGVGFRTNLRTHLEPSEAPVRAPGARTRAAPKLAPPSARTAPGLARPNFYMPFDARLNPASHEVAAHSRAWAESAGMLDGNVWTPRRFDDEKIGLLAAHLAPSLAHDDLELVSDWCTWALYLDDFYLEAFVRRRDLFGAKAFAGRLSCFVSEASTNALAPSNPAEWGLAQLWQRSAPRYSPRARSVLAQRVQAYIEAPLWEIFNTLQDRTPDPIDYCEMRRVSGRAELALSLVQLGDELPPAIAEHRFMRQLSEAFSDVSPLRNDILSYAKEQAAGELLNCVVVLQRFFDSTLDEAARVTNALSRSRIEQFEHGAAVWLPELCDDFELDTPARASVDRHVDRLQSWMAGELEWSRASSRYASASPNSPWWHASCRVPPRAASLGAPFGAAEAHAGSPGNGLRPAGPDRLGLFAHGPSGLGTSAARIHEALRASPSQPLPGPDATPVLAQPQALAQPQVLAQPEAAPSPSAPEPSSSLDDKLRALVARAYANP